MKIGKRHDYDICKHINAFRAKCYDEKEVNITWLAYCYAKKIGHTALEERLVI